jgi:hypothetical protein
MSKKNNNELRARGASPKLVSEINNIAGHLGLKTASFLKQELRKVANTYPPHMKDAPPID